MLFWVETLQKPNKIVMFVSQLFFNNQSLMKNFGQMICRWGGEFLGLFHRVTAGCALMLVVAAGCSDEYDDTELRGNV